MASNVEFIETDLRRFDARAREIIALAWVLGWTIRWLNPKHKAVMLVNGDHERRKVINVPTTNMNANRVNGAYRQILQHTDTDRVKNLAFGTLDMRTQPEAVQRIVTLLGTRLHTFIADSLDRRDREEAAMSPQTKVVNNVGEAIKEAEKGKPRVVSTRPFMASRGDVGVYESDAIVIATLSDGTEIFKCKRCDYMNVKDKSVRSHSNTQHRGEGTPTWKVVRDQQAEISKTNALRNPPKVEPKIQFQDKPADPKAYLPPTPKSIAEMSHTATVAKTAAQAPLHGVTLLAHEIRQAMKASTTAPARDAAVHLVGLPPETRMEIATLILNGHQFEQLRTAADEAIALAREERDAERTRADKLQGDLHALKDILGSIQ